MPYMDVVDTAVEDLVFVFESRIWPQQNTSQKKHISRNPSDSANWADISIHRFPNHLDTLKLFSFPVIF